LLDLIVFETKNKLHNTSSFIKLVTLRSRVRFTLTAMLIGVHAFFVGGIAFYRDFFAQPVTQGGTLTIGIVATVAVIVTMIILEWVYIFISEKWLDPMQKSVVQDIADQKTADQSIGDQGLEIKQ
jgi:uncharacterized membrane protein (DUF485 family)